MENRSLLFVLVVLLMGTVAIISVSVDEVFLTEHQSSAKTIVTTPPIEISALTGI